MKRILCLVLLLSFLGGCSHKRPMPTTPAPPSPASPTAPYGGIGYVIGAETRIPSLTTKIFNGYHVSCAQYVNAQAAIAALPATGGVVDCQSPLSPLALGWLNPGTKAVTLLLGPYTYTFNQIVVQPELKIYGAGSGPTGTILQSVGTNATHAFVLGIATPVQHVKLEGFRVYAAAGNTGQDGLHIFAGINGGGLWYSTFQDLQFFSFCGSAVNMDGSAGGAPPGENQFVKFIGIIANRCVRGRPALIVNGMEGQIDFINGDFDSQPDDLTGTNILIQDSAANLFPFNITFYDITSQAGAIAVSTKGCNMCSFYQMHLEKSPGAYLIGPSVSGTTNTTVQISNSQFNGNVGINSGHGYLVNVTEAAVHAAVVFGPGNNFGAPDHVITGNIAAIASLLNAGGTTVGSFLWNNNSGFPYTTINTGILPDGTGFKHKRVSGCTTGATAGNSCLTTIAWTSAFNDANYTVVCTLVGTTNVGHLGNAASLTAASFQINTVTDTKNAISGTVDCIAVHD